MRPIVIEKREKLRKRSFVRLVDQNYSMACVVRDISDTGTKLRFKFPISFTGKVELHIPETQRVIQSRVVWVNNSDVGISFNVPITITETAPTADDELQNRLIQLQLDVDGLWSLFRQSGTQKDSDAKLAG